MAPVRFHYADVKQISIKGKNSLKGLIIRLFVEEGKVLNNVNYIFCSDDYLLHINNKFLNHNYFTDIISFDLSEESLVIGEIYISVDRVKENAVTHLTSFKSELCRVVLHGALHLCGYKDKKKSEKSEMRLKEDYYLHLFEEKSQ